MFAEQTGGIRQAGPGSDIIGKENYPVWFISQKKMQRPMQNGWGKDYPRKPNGNSLPEEGKRGSCIRWGNTFKLE